jgi:hypothetical protein
MAVTDDYKQALNERIQDLENQLKDLLDAKKFADSHPHAVALLRSLTTKNGNGAQPHATQSVPQTQPVSAPRRGRARGPLSVRVEEIVKAATEPITTKQIVGILNAEHFAWASGNPQVAVNDALRWMEDKGLARIERTVGVENFWVSVGNQDG